MEIDSLDQKILKALMTEGRIKWSALADSLGLSAPAIADRVRRLERAGYLTGYVAQVNAIALGFGLSAFVTVTLSHPQHRQRFLDYVQRQPRVQSCHHIVGDGDYLLKVCCRSTAELEQLLSEDIKALPGVQQTRTTISLRTIKETTAVPIDLAALGE